MAVFCPERNGYALYSDCQECREKTCEWFYCLVVGSRNFTDYAFVKSKLDYLLSKQKNVVIVSGGAPGVDAFAKKYADEKNHLYIEFPAKWSLYGKRAGFVRNEEMHVFISRCKHRACVAFWDGKSRGTAQNFELAKKYGNEIRIYEKEGSR